MTLSLEDLEYRKGMIGASDAPIIMLESPWKTPLQLWEEKLSLRAIPPITQSMQRGIDLEDRARQLFCQQVGFEVKSQRKVNNRFNWMMATLDGINEEKNCIVEIKCPNRLDHQEAVEGRIPRKYYAQLQHQMEVVGYDRCYYFSFDGENGASVMVYRDDEYIKKLIEEESKFYRCLMEFSPPEATERDYKDMDDDLWNMYAKLWKETYLQRKTLEIKEGQIKDELIKLSGKSNAKGAGIKLSRTVRKGCIDFEAIPEIKGKDLEEYRKPSTEYWKIISE